MKGIRSTYGTYKYDTLYIVVRNVRGANRKIKLTDSKHIDKNGETLQITYRSD